MDEGVATNQRERFILKVILNTRLDRYLNLPKGESDKA